MVDLDVRREGCAQRATGRRVILAQVAGFCFGVRRAVEMAENARQSAADEVTTLGDLVHNSQVTGRLLARGIGRAGALAEVEGGTVVLSAHGSAPIVLREARERGLGVIDGTCPFVAKVHRAAKMLVAQGYPILLVGDRGHTETMGVVAAVEEMGGTIAIVGSAEEAGALLLGKRVGVISQSTQRSDVFASVVTAVCRRVPDVRAMKTVCNATEELQEAAVRLARTVDVMIVVGGGRSANTRRLRELCEEAGTPALQVETAADLDPAWLDGRSTVGLTAGASTPDWLIEEVARAINGGELPDDWSVRHPDE
ncbi:MAG TPA: 4-hydroxy-3-methylbut-2-enyl diphosphate reductase [Chthonomonadaceae bacterium]|nr:4-hydroxy-3-methylbut-2-enyl diphosphate reductase [Chthonomonadaceae bacterium]